MADNNNDTSRRGFLTGLGTAGAASLAGCTQILEGESTDDTSPNGNGNGSGGNGNGNGEYTELSIKQIEDLNLTEDLDPSETHLLELELEGDYDEKGSLELTFENDHQQNTAELDYNNGTVQIPVTQPVIHENNVEAELTVNGEKINATETFNLTPPQNYIIEPLIDGEPISNTETDFQFAKHNLNQQQHEQQHREHTRDSYAWQQELQQLEEMGDGDTIRFDPEDRISRRGNYTWDGEAFDISEYKRLNNFEDIISNAAAASSQITGKHQGGTTTSGRETATTTREIAEMFHDTEIISLTAKEFQLDGTGDRDIILQINPETNNYYLQPHHSGVIRRVEERPPQDEYFNTILDFEPGEAEGPRNYRQKSESTMFTLAGMSGIGAETTGMEAFMNDYFMDAATDHMINGGDIYEIKNWTDQLTNTVETLDQLNKNNNTQYVGLALDKNEDLKDTELIVTQDQDIYQQVMEEPEPTSRTEIKNTLGL